MAEESPTRTNLNNLKALNGLQLSKDISKCDTSSFEENKNLTQFWPIPKWKLSNLKRNDLKHFGLLKHYSDTYHTHSHARQISRQSSGPIWVPDGSWYWWYCYLNSLMNGEPYLPSDHGPLGNAAKLTHWFVYVIDFIWTCESHY